MASFARLAARVPSPDERPCFFECLDCPARSPEMVEGRPECGGVVV